MEDEVIRLEELGFDYVPIGHRPPNPADILAGSRFVELIDSVRDTYDQIIIDCAPMLSLADAVETARAADGVLYVVEANRIKARVIESSVERLRRSGAQVYGAVLTKIDERGAEYDYGYGYGYGYGADAQPAPDAAARN